MGVVVIDDTSDKVTYRLGRERSYQWSDPEEQVRADTILRLIFHYQYSPLRMDTEVAVPDRTPNHFADVVVFKDDQRRDPYVTVENGSPQTSPAEREQKVEQLFGYANALAAEFAVYDDQSNPRQCWRVRGAGGLERVRNKIGDIPQNYGEAPEYVFLRDGEHDLQAIDSNVLSRIFDQCHNVLWSGGRLDPAEAFDEMSKLMFAKLYDEQRTANGQPYDFQWGDRETDIMVSERVLNRYKQASERDPGVFTEEIRSDPRKIANVVKHLEHVSLTRTDPDAKGRAFEQFLGEVFRGKLGQYFTRREIVDFLVGLAKPGMDDTLLDPACGSGGFLVYAMKRVFQQIEESYHGDQSTIFSLKDEFAKDHIYGVEINEKISRVAMMDMVINEDGHTNIEVRSAFDNSFENPKIKNGAFSLILTNPPFGDSVKSDERDKLGQSELGDYALSRGKKSAKSEVLFIERCSLFLKNGGRFGMVVPDGVLSNPSDKHVRKYILENFHVLAIVTLPSFAFRKAGSGMRTSLVLARKWEAGEQRTQDYPIFMAIAEHIGYDATARPDSNDLPALLDHYRSGTGSLDDKVIRIQRSAVTGSQRLDPYYYYLGPIIDQAFEQIPHPVHTLHEITGGGIQSGKSPPGGALYSTGAVPIVLVGNIAADGTLDMQDTHYADEDFFEKHGAKASIQPLDILVAKDGATTGKVGLVPPDFDLDRCLFNEHIFRLTIGSELPGDTEPVNHTEAAARRALNTWYVFFFLQSWLGQQQIQREISGGAQGGITKPFMKNIRVPVPPIDERKQFVECAKHAYQEYLDLSDQVREQHKRFEDSLRIDQHDRSGDTSLVREGPDKTTTARIFKRN